MFGTTPVEKALVDQLMRLVEFAAMMPADSLPSII
jgi:hypothetical protein